MCIYIYFKTSVAMTIPFDKCIEVSELAYFFNTAIKCLVCVVLEVSNMEKQPD